MFSYSLTESSVQEMKVESLIAEVELIRSKARNEVLRFKSDTATEADKLRQENAELRRQNQEFRMDNKKLQQALRNVSTVVEKTLDESTTATGHLILPMLPPSTSTPMSKPIKRKRSAHTCFYCDEGFEDMVERRAHMSTEHPEDTVYDCKEQGCQQYYKHEHTLRRHVAHTHTDKEDFECPEEECNKTFRTKQGLNDHVGVHGEEFACHWCEGEDAGRPFANFRTLRRHVRDNHVEVYNEESFTTDVQKKREEYEASKEADD
jgi:hypothetical protein